MTRHDCLRVTNLESMPAQSNPEPAGRHRAAGNQTAGLIPAVHHSQSTNRLTMKPEFRLPIFAISCFLTFLILRSRLQPLFGRGPHRTWVALAVATLAFLGLIRTGNDTFDGLMVPYAALGLAIPLSSLVACLFQVFGRRPPPDAPPGGPGPQAPSTQGFNGPPRPPRRSWRRFHRPGPAFRATGRPFRGPRPPARNPGWSSGDWQSTNRTPKDNGGDH